jgi:hypothetical protein
MRKPAKPKVKFYREISVEADELSRQLQVELDVSGNELAERAIRCLAASCGRRRKSQPSTTDANGA